MSYDITIGEDEFNYTYNLARFFNDCIITQNEKGKFVSGIYALDQMKAKDAVFVLERALKECDDEYYGSGREAFLKQYDAPNGWGDAYGATILLGLMLAACARYPEATIYVY